MSSDKVILHFISFAKNWLAFFKISFSIRSDLYGRFSSSIATQANTRGFFLKLPPPAPNQIGSNVQTPGRF